MVLSDPWVTSVLQTATHAWLYLVVCIVDDVSAALID